MTVPVLLLHVFGITGALTVLIVAARSVLTPKPEAKPAQFTRVYAYQPNDIDRVAEAIYPSLVAREGETPVGLQNAARRAYQQAEGFVTYKNRRNQTQK